MHDMFHEKYISRGKLIFKFTGTNYEGHESQCNIHSYTQMLLKVLIYRKSLLDTTLILRCFTQYSEVLRVGTYCATYWVGYSTVKCC